jgi:hypothetical protein
MVYKRVKNFMLSHPHLSIFLLAFVYVVLAGLFVQLVFLPYLAPPSMNAGNGLLVGYDGGKFHRLALDASMQIKEFGWSAWKLNPGGQVVSGIASIFYSLIAPKPWTLLPLNGVLHGIASVALFEILIIIVKKTGLAYLSSLPFILFPSSLLWNAQMHNENYVIPGVLLLLYGWIFLANIQRGLNLKKSWKAIFSIILGSIIVWVVRDYVMVVINALAFLVVILLMAIYTILLIGKHINLKQLLLYIGMIALVWIISTPSLFNEFNQSFGKQTPSGNGSSSFSLDLGPATSTEISGKSKNAIPWTKSAWLPDLIDSNFKNLSQTRAKFIRDWSYAGSQIDTNVVFSSAYAVINYIPRAMEISLLAPFPSDWLASGYKSAASLMRKESGVEMIIIYVCLLGLIYSLWNFRAKIEIWVLSAISFGMLIVYTCTIPNVGALYRFRYPYLMPLVCLGLSGVIILCQKIIRPGISKTT